MKRVLTSLLAIETTVSNISRFLTLGMKEMLEELIKLARPNEIKVANNICFETIVTPNKNS